MQVSNDFSLDYEYVGIMRGWQTLESSVSNGYDIVDFDLVSTETSRIFKDRVEVLDGLSQLLEKAQSSQEQDRRFLQKLTASECFINFILERPIDFGTYISKTLGFEPREIPESIISTYKSSCEECLDGFNLKYTQESYEGYIEVFQVKEVSEVEKYLDLASSFWVEKVRNILEFTDSLNYKVSYVAKDEPWSVGLWGNVNSGVRVLINIHERHKFTRGQCKYLPSHEIAGHALQFSCRQHQIELGVLRPALGMVSVFNPDIALSEGLAQSLPYFLVDEEELDKEFLVAKRIREHRDLVLHNGHFFLESNTSWEDALDYCTNNLPFMKTDEITRELSERVRNPLLKTYMFCYAPAFLSYRHASKKLSLAEKQQFLKFEYYDIPVAQDFFSKWMPF